MHKDQLFYQFHDLGKGAHGIRTGVIQVWLRPVFFGYEDLRYDFSNVNRLELYLNYMDEKDSRNERGYWYPTRFEINSDAGIKLWKEFADVAEELKDAFTRTELMVKSNQATADDQLNLAKQISWKRYVSITRDKKTGYYYPTEYAPTNTGHKWILWYYEDAQQGRNKKPANYIDEDGRRIVYVGFVFADLPSDAFHKIFTRLEQYERASAKGWINSGKPVQPKFEKWNLIKQID